MSGYLLDTNVVSEFKRRGEPDSHVRDWLRATDPDLFTDLEHDLTLVTRNVKDFVGLEVTMVNPWDG